MEQQPSLIEIVKEIYLIWVTEKPNQLAAALAYFGMFSFAAVIYVAFRLAGVFIDEAAAAERFYTRVATVLGTETATFIQNSVVAVSSSKSGGSPFVTIVSLVSLLFAAMGLFLQLKYVLNRIWQVPLAERGQRLALIRRYWFAFIIVIVLGLLIILGTVFSVVLAWFGSLVTQYIGGSNLLITIETLALICAIVLANAFIYKLLPDIKLAWRDVWPGSIATAILFVIGGVVIGLYFRIAGVGSAFEAAGAFAVLMIAIYYFAQIFLIGALTTRVYARRFGSMSELKKQEK